MWWFGNDGKYVILFEVMKSCVESFCLVFCVSGSLLFTLVGIKKKSFWQEELKMPFLS